MRTYQAQELQRLYDLCRELKQLIDEAAFCEDAREFFRNHKTIKDGIQRANVIQGRLLDAIDDMDLAALRRELRKTG